MSDAGEDLPYFHSIVVKVGDTFAQFDFNKLLESINRNGHGPLRLAFDKYSPWSNDNAEKVSRRLVPIHQLLFSFETRLALVAEA